MDKSIKIRKFFAAAIICGMFFAISASAASNANFRMIINPMPQCSDTLDNDGDGLIDYPADPGCSSASDNDETDAVFQCSDGIDNDGDGLIDYPADPGCSSASDNDETNVSGGGGGGGTVYVPPVEPTVQSSSTLTLTGVAYPFAYVGILKDGIKVGTAQAGANALFTFTINNIAAGSYLFSFVTMDDQGNRSTLFTVQVNVVAGTDVSISNVFIAPTISLDKLEVKLGDFVEITGQTTPNSDLEITINSPTEIILRTRTDANGNYLLNLNSKPLAMGEHFARARVTYNSYGGLQSSYSEKVSFIVGTRNVYKNDEDKKQCGIKVDLNGDCRVNLIDYSIEAYWYKRSGVPAKYDFNGDGKVNLIDFSIMAYYWTG